MYGVRKEIYLINCFHQHLLNLLDIKLHTHSTMTILLQLKGKKISVSTKIHSSNILKI
jgi:hypothetical protein